MSTSWKAERDTQLARAKALRGKTIRTVKIHGSVCSPDDDCGHGYLCEPEIVFTDGTCLRLVATEGCADYGTILIYPGRRVARGKGGA